MEHPDMKQSIKQTELELDMNKEEVEAMTRRWMASCSGRLCVSPAMAPAAGNSESEDGLLFLRDKHFELHGEIMMFALVAFFSLFILFLVMLPYLKRLSNHESEYSGSVAPQNCPFPWLRKRRMEDVAPEVSLQGENEFSRKFPL
ncbi:uncharacterized protein LOC121238995 [Juglans microcarpa x Juglans regia]|uniref:uncharacterized protein LOC121238995 n=1 Tax=Juglans microcarpa x Juglans regia TaxID=2249226 RepID=UPI001B7E7CA6|nr:uncharacterized protein LOC121238995 [Juglans microcarpa x Juglans regia]